LRCTEKSLAHRNSRDFAIAAIFARFFEVYGSGGNDAGDEAVGESGDDVGLEGQSRDAMANGGEHRWTRGVASDADDDIRLEIANHAAGGPQGSRQIEHCPCPGREADILKGANFYEIEGKAGLRHEAGFNAASGSNKENFSGELLLKLVGDGESGNDVSSGASARDDDAHGLVKI